MKNLTSTVEVSPSGPIIERLTVVVVVVVVWPHLPSSPAPIF